ncbi:DNA-binding transcriptional LysR family regulator [Kribbella orskensis]|uniref:DNA-binding transcriptional LysR family regulator n=1 Tax=Kribbella orskensis TaxID=2512216 RepID=A0ABY2BJ93_9ACTN|nr:MULTISPECIES: LysR family transcriptional regulator [Kribbella]TCN39257.1 DNA-binding transcriptional LysR family regulator [Kribbella sp. VKM Ac-2500]TCO21904.1 DNA-binding transcriptional LysR family regulator [Kribbella orskensis]
MTPELRLLRSFVAIVEEGSLTRAAGRLHIAQQSLSQQLRQLEAQYGAALVERTSRGVRLTVVGRVLLPEARKLLAEADRVTALVRQAASGEIGPLRVGFLSSVANYLMPPVVRAFRERHPTVDLQAQEVSIAKLVAGLRNGEFDAGLTRPPLVDDLATEHLLDEPVAAVLPEGHPLAGRDEIALAELADESWLLTARSSWPPWHREYDRAFALAGYVPRVVQRGTSPQNLLALVAAGLGVTRLPLSTRSLRNGGVVFVPLADDYAAVMLAHRDEPLSKSLELFAVIVREVSHTLDPAHL